MVHAVYERISEVAYLIQPSSHLTDPDVTDTYRWTWAHDPDAGPLAVVLAVSPDFVECLWPH